MTATAPKVGNVLNKLKLLSDSADLIIHEHNNEDDTVRKWLSSIKEMADSIVSKSARKSSVGKDKAPDSCAKVPNLRELVTGEESNRKQYRISTLLPQKDRVRHVRKSRQSLRKIVLGKDRSNQWKITNQDVSVKEQTPKRPSSNEARLLNLQKKLSQAKNKGLNSSIKKISEENHELNSSSNNQVSEVECEKSVGNLNSCDQTTPIQSNEVLAPNTCDTPSVKRIKLDSNLTQVVKVNKMKMVSASEIKPVTPDASGKDTSTTSDKFVTPENKDNFITANDQTFIKDKVQPRTSGNTRVKRKSSMQLGQGQTKKARSVKKNSPEIVFVKSACKTVEDSAKSRPIRKGKAAKGSAVIPAAKISGVTIHQVNVENDKRILQEIQKKEEAVEQNAKKLKSLRQKKIEENKKTREMKMEKAMQQRMKIEKEKEERLRCRTNSKQQENVQLNKSATKKALKKIQNMEDRISSAKKLRSTPQAASTSPSKKLRSQLEPAKVAPPKPVRTPAKKPPAKITPDVKKADPAPKEAAPLAEKEVFTKPILNTTFNAAKLNLTSTPASKKNVSSSSKTPLNAATRKLTSYAMTPGESSFVSYDISEIKSDDDDDDEEEEVNRKPIPAWATGVRLKTALINQNYNMGNIDLDELFGNFFGTPDLEAIMGVQKKHYFKRTSSAIWLDSPNSSFRTR